MGAQDNLESVKQALTNYQNNLDHAWVAAEFVYINRAIDAAKRNIGTIQTNINELDASIAAAIEDIRREEEARKLLEKPFII